MGYFKNNEYKVPFVVIAKDPILKGRVWCGEYKEFFAEPSYFHDRATGEKIYSRETPKIVRGIKWNNMHWSSILSTERHAKLPTMGNNYYKDTQEYQALKKLQDEFHENHYGRVTRYLLGDEPIPNQQAPAHWFNNFKLWVIGWEYYQRPFMQVKWGHFKE